MKKLSFLVFITLLTTYIFAENGIKINIAVNDLVGKGIEKSTAGIISDRLRSELINTGVFRVMERNEMENVLKEQGFQKTGACDDASCLVEVGQLLGVDRMVAGSVGRVGDFFTISLRIINVATGEILFTVNVDFEGTVKDVISTAIGDAANKLAAGAGVEISKAAVAGKKGDLYIETDRTGASVEIDGKTVKGTTPLTLKGYAAGEHRIVVRKGAWYGSEKVYLSPDDLLKVIISMQKGKGSIKIFCNVSGADVFLDGKPAGQTPVKLDDVSAGEHIVEIKKEGYLTAIQEITVSIGEIQNVSFSLEKSAFLSFNVTPKSAAVIVNGNSVDAEKLSGYTVPAGEVDIQIEASGYDVFRDKVTLDAGEKKTINIRLKSVFGILQVNSQPESCMVFLNEKEAGMTPYSNERMTPGNYMLKVVKETYEPVKKNISVIKDSTLVYDVKLKHTKEYLDSIAAVKKVIRRKIQWVRRIAFGAIAAGCGAMGIYMNYKSNEAYDKYMADKNQFSGNHEQLYDDVEKYEIIRNVMYGLAGGFGIGFAFSIPF